MSCTFRFAGPVDLDLLYAMHEEFARETGQEFEPGASRAALEGLLAQPAFGRAFIIEDGEEPIGYLALCFGYSLEFRGRDAFLDEIYVRPGARGRGLAREALRFAEDACRESGVRALHLEVDRHNASAQRLYRSAGFADRDNYLMTRKLR
jgi:ribosomal protein S18 acetylase RimI-like enzyme